ncbi:YoaK family protein [Streptomyces sp. ATexAB-D23]|uniref:YoaK family protein n=1 Tax=Streptomyces sp. SID4913 TaxID=2690266 RepID=UPI00039E4F09|nr:YoaK family protein [Streptomyces sp. ATexAB-D23]
MATPRSQSSTGPAGPEGAGAAHGHPALLLLSAASGAADAFVFICVGQVFAGVMTGNLVLLGASAVGAGEEGVAVRVVTALFSYGCGVAGAAVVGERVWRRVPVMLLAEVVLLAAGAALWAARLITSDTDRLGLLALMGLAMGIQGRVRATPTNYFTGTLTSLIGRLAVGRRHDSDGWVAGRLAAVVAGAALAALMVRLWPAAGAVAPAALAGAALLAGTVVRRGPDDAAGAGEPGKGKPRPDRGNPAGAA